MVGGVDTCPRLLRTRTHTHNAHAHTLKTLKVFEPRPKTSKILKTFRVFSDQVDSLQKNSKAFKIITISLKISINSDT